MFHFLWQGAPVCPSPSTPALSATLTTYTSCRLTELVKSLATVLEKLAMVNEKILHGALWLVTGCKDPASYEAKVVTVYAAGQRTDRFRVQTSVAKSVNLTA
jgi:hypothetical protein